LGLNYNAVALGESEAPIVSNPGLSEFSLCIGSWS
jgi:hypothetical protein